MSYTLTELQNKVKRRLLQLRATTGATVESEVGNLLSDNAINDAVNAGRKMLMVAVRNAELWGAAEAVFQTTSNIAEYSLAGTVLKILNVLWDVESSGIRNASTYMAVDVETRQGEERCIRDPMDAPSVTNPKFRVCNKGIRLIVSTDGTVTASKYILVEYIKELTDLTTGEDTTGLSGTLDEMVISWAIYELTRYALPAVAEEAKNTFYANALAMNRRNL